MENEALADIEPTVCAFLTLQRTLCLEKKGLTRFGGKSVVD